MDQTILICLKEEVLKAFSRSELNSFSTLDNLISEIESVKSPDNEWSPDYFRKYFENIFQELKS